MGDEIRRGPPSGRHKIRLGRHKVWRKGWKKRRGLTQPETKQSKLSSIDGISLGRQKSKQSVEGVNLRNSDH